VIPAAICVAGVIGRMVSSNLPPKETMQGGVAFTPVSQHTVGTILDKELEAQDWNFVRYADDFLVIRKIRSCQPSECLISVERYLTNETQAGSSIATKVAFICRTLVSISSATSSTLWRARFGVSPKNY